MFQPKIFIGSSSEGLTVAQSIRNQLQDDAEIDVWDTGVFCLGQGTLESLVNALDDFDFAILVLTPDDVIESRNQISQSPRDNVLFECGLFMGRLGRSRTFVVYDKDKNIKLPSDLAGITLASYRSRPDSDLETVLHEACEPIRDEIRRQGYFASRKVSGIEIGAFPFKDVFGKDVFSPNSFHLVYAELGLIPINRDNQPISHPYFKPGDQESIGLFSIERPISSSEVRAAKYLAESIGKETKTAPSLSSDLELQGRLDLSFVAFGGPLSNYKTRDVITNSGNNLLKFDNTRFIASHSGKIVLRPESGFDYGLILKIHPNQFTERNWFACAGLGEWGTSGAAWYLAKKWRDIQTYAGDSTFGIIVRVRPRQDESAEPVVQVKNESDVNKLVASLHSA